MPVTRCPWSSLLTLLSVLTAVAVSTCQSGAFSALLGESSEVPIRARKRKPSDETAAESCPTGRPDCSPARLRQRAFLTPISLVPSAGRLCRYPWARQPEGDYTWGYRVHESMSSLEGENAVHGERRLWRRMHRRYSCHVMLAFGILCKGLTYY